MRLAKESKSHGFSAYYPNQTKSAGRVLFSQAGWRLVSLALAWSLSCEGILPQSSGQKLNTPANQICRWPVLELIWPNALDVTVVFGLPKCGVFVAPNHSVRNWKFTRSVSLKERKRLASRLKMPGPRRYGKLRPVLPNWARPVATGANA